VEAELFDTALAGAGAGADTVTSTADFEGAGDTEGALVSAITLVIARAAIRRIEKRLVNFIV
jgi:hypothetical protein